MKIAEDRGDGKRISEYCKAVVEEKDDNRNEIKIFNLF